MSDELPFQELIDRLMGDGREVCVSTGGLFPQNARYEWRRNHLSAEAAQAIDDLRTALAAMAVAHSEEARMVERQRRFAMQEAAQLVAEKILGIREIPDEEITSAVTEMGSSHAPENNGSPT